MPGTVVVDSHVGYCGEGVDALRVLYPADEVPRVVSEDARDILAPAEVPQRGTDPCVRPGHIGDRVAGKAGILAQRDLAFLRVAGISSAPSIEAPSGGGSMPARGAFLRTQRLRRRRKFAPDLWTMQLSPLLALQAFRLTLAPLGAVFIAQAAGRLTGA